jgi:hypothetical protein
MGLASWFNTSLVRVVVVSSQFDRGAEELTCGC